MLRILLIRHALTDATGIRISGRQPCVYLNLEGLKQSQNLAENLKIFPISAVYCSPLERAIETAAPITNIHNLDCIISEDFLEIDFGKWTNLTFDEVRKDPQFSLFNTFRSNTRVPGGETMAEAQMRMIKGIEKLNARHANHTVAIITHADLIKAAIAWYTGINLDFVHRIEISPASVSILEIFEETARITLMNGMTDPGYLK